MLCLRCQAAIDQNDCRIYGSQCNDCPLYLYWERHKQPATFIKLPLPIENHLNEAHDIKDNVDREITDGEEKIHTIMKKILKPIEYKVYEGLYINKLSEEVVAKNLGFISNEGRRPGLEGFIV